MILREAGHAACCMHRLLVSRTWAFAVGNVVLYLDYTEISVAAFYSSNEIRGLYPGKVHSSMVKGTYSWSGNIPVSLLFHLLLFILVYIST